MPDKRGTGLVALMLLLTPAVADACRCVPRTAKVLARAADAIVIADVAAIDDSRPADRVYRLRVTRSWKARIVGPITVLSEATTCRASLVPGTPYLVYLKREGRVYRTDACSGNLPVARAKAAIAAIGS